VMLFFPITIPLKNWVIVYKIQSQVSNTNENQTLGEKKLYYEYLSLCTFASSKPQ
jgi:hypothetical protein